MGPAEVMSSISEIREKFIEAFREEKRKFRNKKLGWKVIHQMMIGGHEEEWARYLEFIDTHQPFGDHEDLIMRKTGRDKRRSMRARYIGLLTEDMKVTDPSREFYRHPENRKAILDNQLEKWYFPVAEFQYTPSDYEAYTDLGYGLYPYFLILRVLFYVGERDKSTEPRCSLSQQEFLLFCLNAKRYSDYEERGQLILDFRKSASKYKKLMGLIKEKNTYNERILQDLQLSSHISLKDDRILLEDSESARERLLKFEYLRQTGNLIDYGNNKKEYFNLLYSKEGFDVFHERVNRISLNTDALLLAYITDFIKSSEFIYDESVLGSFYASLRAKPFVIVTGLSGTGKTKLCELFPKAACEDPDKQFIRIPVRPDWNDDRFLLGFFNLLTERYHYEPFLDFVMTASGDVTRPYFVCLDEMNLAHVEYYFSSFLSGMESFDRLIPLHDFPSADEVENLDSRELDEFCDRFKIKASTKRNKRDALKDIFRGIPPRQLKIPPNLFFTGTVNIDETTYLFSPKVLDRANVIEFMKVDITKREGADALGLQRDEIFHGVFKRQFVSFSEEDYKKWLDEHWHEIVEERLAVIHGILENSSLHFGYRTRDEILRFLYCSRYILKLQDALDFQIKQKILPKIKGPTTIRDTVLKFWEKLAEWGYSRSLEKLNKMVEKLDEQGFTSYF